MGLKDEPQFKEAENGLMDGSIPMVVTHDGGEEETLHLTLPLSMREGKHFNILKDAQGYEHFFNKDGTYDGWGKAL